MMRKDIQMTQPFLQPFYVSYLNGDNQEIDEELVFAKSEPDAMRQILSTFEDTKFVYETKSAAEFLNISHAWLMCAWFFLSILEVSDLCKFLIKWCMNPLQKLQFELFTQSVVKRLCLETHLKSISLRYVSSDISEFICS